MSIRKAAQCTGKQRHDTEEKATAHKMSLVRSGARMNRLSVYRCRFCAAWHVGNKPKPKRQR